MNIWKLLKKLLGLGLFLSLKIRGILWITGVVALVGGLLFLANRHMNELSVIPTLVCTAAAVAILFLLAANLPDIRIFDLLYL